MVSLTTKAELVGYHKDPFGYITYVFQRLDNPTKEEKYIMCTRYPNWEHKSLEIGDIGFLSINYVKAGDDTWFDGVNNIPYKYDAVQFLRFVELVEKKDHEYIM